MCNTAGIEQSQTETIIAKRNVSNEMEDTDSTYRFFDEDTFFIEDT